MMQAESRAHKSLKVIFRTNRKRQQDSRLNLSAACSIQHASGSRLKVKRSLTLQLVIIYYLDLTGLALPKSFLASSFQLEL